MPRHRKTSLFRTKKTDQWYSVSELGGDLIGICPVFEGTAVATPVTSPEGIPSTGSSRATPVATPAANPAVVQQQIQLQLRVCVSVI